MKTIHIITPEYWPRCGGVADYTRQIALELAQAGDQVHVWCPAGCAAEAGDALGIHPVLGRFTKSDLAAVDVMLDEFPAPRRLLVQWVPHGYGFRSMNFPFCLWLLARARKGDVVELMVHEAYLHFWEGSWRQTAAAAVHRAMTVVLLRAAQRVWVSIPAWEGLWKPYAMGRPVPFAWLPVPSALDDPDPRAVAQIRARLGGDIRPIVGHLGTYGSAVASVLLEVLPALLRRVDASVLLIGAGSEQFCASAAAAFPELSGRLTSTGTVARDALAAHVAACDVLVQPYPDGVSSRRTTAMAGLRLGVPVVTTGGRLTEPAWSSDDVVRLVSVGDSAGLVDAVESLLHDSQERQRLAASARAFYDRTFDVRRTVAEIRAVA